MGVLRASVDASKRENWVAGQVERSVNALITNPELVKTGLDLLDFPTIVFMQSGFNVYTPMQAAGRSWRIGQKLEVRVIFLGYAGTSQMECLKLMAKKIFFPCLAHRSELCFPPERLQVLAEVLALNECLDVLA